MKLTFRDISIRHKVTLLVLLASLLALGLTVIALVAYEFASLREHAVRNLSAEADAISVTAKVALDFDDDKTATLILNTLKGNHQIAAGCIYRPNGKIYRQYVRSGLGKFSFPAPQNDGHHFESNSLLLFRSIYSGNENVGKLFLRYDLESPWTALPQYTAIICGIAMVLFIVALFSATILQKTISLPLSKLAQSARQVSEEKDFGIRVKKTSEDEIGQLTDTFNQMLAAIESRDRSLNEVNHQLQVREQELASSNVELEQRVKDRTTNLRQTIDYLEGFCYSIAHDLRAPLRAISGYASVVNEDYAAQLEPEGRELLKRISKSAKHMDQLMMDLLAFGKLSQIDLTFSTLDLNHEAEQVVSSLSEQINAAHGKIKIQPRMPSVIGNETVLEQALTNLISNALKFSRPAQSPSIEISSQTKGRMVRILVSDNGIGVPAEHQERIFRVFERLHPERQYTGTGIGLAIVKRGVERMRGRVGVESTPGQGSCFWVELPNANVSPGLTVR